MLPDHPTRLLDILNERSLTSFLRIYVIALLEPQPAESRRVRYVAVLCMRSARAALPNSAGGSFVEQMIHENICEH
jgi:hypothetical protein